MKILGISCYYHDSAAALVIDGDIKSAVQEERFTRKKHDSSFPVNSIKYCLSQANIKANEIDSIVFYEKPLLKFERILESYLYCAPTGFSSFMQAISVWIKQKFWISTEIRKILEYKNEILFSEHHLSHAASAFFPSPFKEAVIVTCDGVGEWATTSIGKGQNNKIELLKELHFPHSLGLLYSAFTYYTGFKVNSGEYKVMGLAPYGESKYTKLILDNLIDIKDDGSFHLNMDYFNYIGGLTMTSGKFHKLFGGGPRKPEGLVTQKEMDLARSIQDVTEIVMEKMVKFAMKETGFNKLCMAGGVALNCVSNGKLLKKLPVKDIFIQPSAGDAGGALGAALIAWYMVKNNKRMTDEIHDSQKGSFLGNKYSEEEIESFLKKNDIAYATSSLDDFFKLLAQIISEENVVGVFQGRMEFGPRALGARSIMADARSPSMQRKMNLKIKYRESFRPFAPIVLEEDVKSNFNFSHKSPYMLIVADILEQHRIPLSDEQKKLFGIDKLNIPRSHVPAITHVDYSARLETVNDKDNPFCYKLLKAFKALTGVGILVNTSFNVRGEPIVCTPEDAYRCFMRTGMDYLVMENFIIKKSNQKPVETDDSWKKEFALD